MLYYVYLYIYKHFANTFRYICIYTKLYKYIHSYIYFNCMIYNWRYRNADSDFDVGYAHRVERNMVLLFQIAWEMISCLDSRMNTNQIPLKQTENPNFVRFHVFTSLCLWKHKRDFNNTIYLYYWDEHIGYYILSMIQSSRPLLQVSAEEIICLCHSFSYIALSSFQ